MDNEPKYQLNLTEDQLTLLTSIFARKDVEESTEAFASLKKTIDEKDLIVLDPVN